MLNLLWGIVLEPLHDSSSGNLLLSLENPLASLIQEPPSIYIANRRREAEPNLPRQLYSDCDSLCPMTFGNRYLAKLSIFKSSLHSYPIRCLTTSNSITAAAADTLSDSM